MSPQKPEDQNQVKKKPPNKLLKKRIFYLDLENRTTNASKKSLVDDILKLGGSIEEFFSKDNITTVVTDAPVVKLRELQANPAASAQKIPDNPVLNPNKAAVKSRAETILERAKQQNKQTKPPFDLLETAIRWGLEVWSYSKLIKWIASSTPASASRKKHQPEVTPDVIRKKKNDVISVPSTATCLEGPYVKFECTDGRYRPVYQQFRRFPKICFSNYAGVSPFYDTPVGGPSKLVVEGDREQTPPAVAARATVTNPIKHKLRRIQEPETKIAAVKKTKGLKKEVKKVKEGEKKGYCELCDQNYDKLMQHLDDEKHRMQVDNPKLWNELDNCILLANKVYSAQQTNETLECSI